MKTMNRREFLIVGAAGVLAVTLPAFAMAEPLPDLVPGKAASVWVKQHPTGPWVKAHRACPSWAAVSRYEPGEP